MDIMDRYSHKNVLFFFTCLHLLIRSYLHCDNVYVIVSTIHKQVVKSRIENVVQSSHKRIYFCNFVMFGSHHKISRNTLMMLIRINSILKILFLKVIFCFNSLFLYFDEAKNEKITLSENRKEPVVHSLVRIDHKRTYVDQYDLITRKKIKNV